MKFANLTFQARGINSIGDNMQLIAIDNLYKKMGITESEIIYIDYHKLADYDGDYVVLPISMPMVDYIQDGLAGRFSPRIIPVFLGLTMVRQYLYKKEVEYLKKYEPIGCRDEWCLNTLRKYNIKSYLHGCITFTLPERQISNPSNKVYIVDVDEEIFNLLPKHLFEGKKLIYKTHVYSELEKDPKLLAVEQYKEYKDNASLVVTGLLHCALPCYAAGIPVIMINSKISYRKAFLEKLINIWDAERIKSLRNPLDLRPDIIDNDKRKIKKKIMELSISRINDAYNTYKNFCDISFFYEERNKSNYINDAVYFYIEWIKNNWFDKDKIYNYSIWGLTQISEYIFQYINDNYPNAILLNVYDSFKKVNFMGKTSQVPDNFQNVTEEIVFVTAPGAFFEAQKKSMENYNSNIKFVCKTIVNY